METLTVNTITEYYKFNCSICKDTYTNPKVLPCLHSYCQGCLDKMIRNNGRNIACPTCQVSVPVPTKGVEAFPTNFFINNMLTIMAVQNPTKCTNCEDISEATARCLDCVENMCSNCVFAHKRIRQTKDHRILTFEEIQSNALQDALKSPSFCPTHKREILKYFCETCEGDICRECAIYEHRDHEYLDLSDAKSKYIDKILGYLKSTEEKVPVLRSAAHEVEQVTQSLRENVDAVKMAVRTTIQKHIHALEEQERDLMQSLEELFQGKERVLTTQQETLELQLNSILSSCEFTKSVLRYGNEAEIMLVKKNLISRLHTLSNYEPQCDPEENDIIDFHPNNEDLTNAIMRIGKITTSRTFPKLCEAEGEGLEKAKLRCKAKFNVIAYDRHGELTQQGGDEIMVYITTDENEVTDNIEVTDNNDGTYTVTYTPVSLGDRKIEVSIRGKPIQESPFTVNVTSGIDCDTVGPVVMTIMDSSGKPGDCEPWGVAITPDDTMIVSDHSNHKLNVYDAKGVFMFQFGSRGKSEGEVWYPAGIVVDNTGKIFVSDHGNNRIQTFSAKGEYLKKFGAKGTGQGQMKGPCGIAIDSTGRLVVADRDNHRIQIFDSEGKFLATFGGHGDADGKLNCPRHVCTSNQDEIYVSDAGNFRIQKYDKSGKFLAKFGRKGSGEGEFNCPAGIFVDSEGHVIVLDLKNSNVQIFDAEFNFLKAIGGDEKNGPLSKPTGVVVNNQGKIIVADRGNHKVQVF